MNQLHEKKHNILIVDDEPIILRSTASLLEGYGYAATCCDKSIDVVARIYDDKFDAVLTDIMMPDLSGIELLQEIQKLTIEVPVILMTAYADLDTAIDAIKCGAFDFITKPFNPDLLLHTIERAIKHHDLLDLEKDYKDRLVHEVDTKTRELRDALISINSLNREIILRLTAVAEYRDTDTGTHISRIGVYSRAIAERLHMPEDFTEMISYASSLHDIGKIGIKDSILLKPGALTKDEFEIMKAHTTIGADMLSGSSHAFMNMAASIALTHHERWDGTGYPQRLKGGDIPVEGRITNICDQYDALISRRPYKPALSHNQVYEILTEGDGRTIPAHFDPQVLKAFKEVAQTFEEIYINHRVFRSLE
jgi:putative two-component system response regulator